MENTTAPKQRPDGIYFDLDMKDYLADPALGSSDIKNLKISPLTYWANSHMNPFKLPEEETEATQLGTLIHEAIFEPGKNVFVAKPAGMSFAAKAGKAWRQDQLDAKRVILTPKQNNTLSTIFRAAEASGVRAATEGAIPEVSYFWTTETGYRCKVRMDALSPTQGFDLKTFANSMNKDMETCIAHAVANYGYHISGFWYRTGLDDMIAKLKQGKGIPEDATPPQLQLLKAIAEHEGHYPYWYIFMEKEGVPNVIVREFTPRSGGETNAYWRAAHSDVKDATNSFAKNMAQFKEGEMWMNPVPWKSFEDEEFGAARWILEE